MDLLNAPQFSNPVTIMGSPPMGLASRCAVSLEDAICGPRCEVAVALGVACQAIQKGQEENTSP